MFSNSMKKIFLGLAIIKSTDIIAQDSAKKNQVNFSAYVEVYYNYDFNKPVNNN